MNCFWFSVSKGVRKFVERGFLYYFAMFLNILNKLTLGFCLFWIVISFQGLCQDHLCFWVQSSLCSKFYSSMAYCYYVNCPRESFFQPYQGLYWILSNLCSFAKKKTNHQYLRIINEYIIICAWEQWHIILFIFVLSFQGFLCFNGVLFITILYSINYHWILIKKKKTILYKLRPYYQGKNFLACIRNLVIF